MIKGMYYTYEVSGKIGFFFNLFFYLCVCVGGGGGRAFFKILIYLITCNVVIGLKLTYRSSPLL